MHTGTATAPAAPTGLTAGAGSGQVAGPKSTVDWACTFGWILLPGTIGTRRPGDLGPGAGFFGDCH